MTLVPPPPPAEWVEAQPSSVKCDASTRVGIPRQVAQTPARCVGGAGFRSGGPRRHRCRTASRRGAGSHSPPPWSRTPISSRSRLSKATNWPRVQPLSWHRYSRSGSDAVLDSIGIRFATIGTNSNPGSELTVTLRSVNESNLPDSALCTLTDPATFGSSGVQYFDAPATGSGKCPKLSAGTNYAVNVQRQRSATAMRYR